jgi:hypothetical protein
MTHPKEPPDQEDYEKTVITPGPSKKTRPAEPPPIEVVLTRHNQTLDSEVASAPPDRYRMLEVWTRNRIYIVDSHLKCIEVIDQHSGLLETENSMLGAQLVGGQRKYANSVHFSRPFPVPGTEALFVRPDDRLRPMGFTSKVERVVLHIHVSSIAKSSDEDDWADVTSHLLKSSFVQSKK